MSDLDDLRRQSSKDKVTTDDTENNCVKLDYSKPVKQKAYQVRDSFSITKPKIKDNTNFYTDLPSSFDKRTLCVSVALDFHGIIGYIQTQEDFDSMCIHLEKIIFDMLNSAGQANGKPQLVRTYQLRGVMELDKLDMVKNKVLKFKPKD